MSAFRPTKKEVKKTENYNLNNKGNVTTARGKLAEVVQRQTQCLTSFFWHWPEITREEWEKMESKKVIKKQNQNQDEDWMGGQ